MIEEQIIFDIRQYAKRQIDHYQIMKNNESHSSFDDELFDGQRKVAEDILEYIDLTIKAALPEEKAEVYL